MSRLPHSAQRDVQDFHEALEAGIGDSPKIRNGPLRVELIREEYKEFKKAVEKDDLVAAIDGLCDILFVTYGAAVEFGVNLAPFWDEVCRTNMAKINGPVRSDGKRLKPEGWIPPDIKGILEREYS